MNIFLDFIHTKVVGDEDNVVEGIEYKIKNSIVYYIVQMQIKLVGMKTVKLQTTVGDGQEKSSHAYNLQQLQVLSYGKKTLVKMTTTKTMQETVV